LEATNEAALRIIPLNILENFGERVNGAVNGTVNGREEL
jgi:hypothetical protein